MSEALKWFLGGQLIRFCNRPVVLILLNNSKANGGTFVIPYLALITHRKADTSKSSSWCGNCQCAHPASDIPALPPSFSFTHTHILGSNIVMEFINAMTLMFCPHGIHSCVYIFTGLEGVNETRFPSVKTG